MRSILILCAALTACSPSDKPSKPVVAQPEPAAGDGSAKPPPPTPRVPAVRDLDALLLGELAVAAQCSDSASPYRPWCIAATGWSGAQAAPLPEGKAVLLGLTVELERGKPAADALVNRVTLSALALRTEGGQGYGKITMIKSQSDAESRMAAEAVAGASAVFKGKSKTVALHPDLAQYVDSLAASADYPIEKGEGSWAWSGASQADLRKSGDHWIAIERPTQGPPGIFVSIFTDKLSR